MIPMPTSTVVQIATPTVSSAGSMVSVVRCGQPDYVLTEEITIPSVEALRQGSDIGQSHNSRRGANRRERKDESHQTLLPRGHLQAPDNEDRKQPQRPISHDIERRDTIRQADDNVRVDTVLMARVKVPPVAYRPALEDNDEEERTAKDRSEAHDQPDDPDVHRLAGDAQQEEADRDFEEGCGEGIEDLAEVPVLNVQSVDSSTMLVQDADLL